MLFRKTFRNALATLLGMALALAPGAAYAQDVLHRTAANHARWINLDAAGTPADPYRTALVAVETLVGSTSETVFDRGSGQTYYKIYVDPNQLRVRASIGIRGDDNRQLYFRYDLSGAVWSRALPGDTAVIPDSVWDSATLNTDTQVNLTREAGGARGEDYVIFSAPDNEVISEPTTITLATGENILGPTVSLALHDKLAILPSGGPATITQSVFLELSDAIAGTGGLSPNSGPVAMAVPSVVTRGQKGSDLVASVSSGFTRLAQGGWNTFGGITVSVGGGTAWNGYYDAANGENRAITMLSHVATAGQVSAAGNSGSLITFSGDFSTGVFGYSRQASCAAAGAVGGVTVLATRDAQRQAVNSAAIPVNDTAAGPRPSGVTTGFCMAIPNDNEDEINAGIYKASLDYQGAAPNAAFPPRDLDEMTIGRIVRDGTRVYIPYLTTYEGYVQRVVIVNRSAAPVDYRFSFTEEDGVTTTAGDEAQGQVPAESTMVLRASDIVSISGKTRTAATLDVVAPRADVDIATTQLNRDTQGTDTVVYDSIVTQ